MTVADVSKRRPRVLENELELPFAASSVVYDTPAGFVGVSRQGSSPRSDNGGVFLLPLHMGALHPFEKVLTLVLAFGPFLILAAVILIRRRQDRAEEAAQEAQRDR